MVDLFKKIFLFIFLISFWFFIIQKHPEYTRMLNPRVWPSEARKMTRRTLLHIGIALLAMFFMFLMIPVVNSAAEVAAGGPTIDIDNMVSSTAKISPWLLMMIAVSVPVIEEWLFRGVVLTESRKKWGTATGVILSSLLFGLIHWTNPGYSIFAVIVPFCCGFILAGVYLIGGLKCSIITHSGSNFLAWLVWML